jgi:solute carrier family 45 protein 1/2/4
LLNEVKLKTYLVSIIRMPRSLFVLCLTNLFCWMSLVCYSLYFTDFVGQAVYGGDPKAPRLSNLHRLYNDGVRLGSFGMSLYSLSCAVYSMFVERLVDRFGKYSDICLNS